LIQRKLLLHGQTHRANAIFLTSARPKGSRQCSDRDTACHDGADSVAIHCQGVFVMHRPFSSVLIPSACEPLITHGENLQRQSTPTTPTPAPRAPMGGMRALAAHALARLGLK
jgi:hypothetical protein